MSGIGRGDENGRTNWLHLYAQDDWQARNNLTFNLGLRYEFNQHMYDTGNRLSSIDLDAGRFVIASDDDGTIDPSATPLLGQIPLQAGMPDLADTGSPIVVAEPQSAAAVALSGVAERVAAELALKM